MADLGYVVPASGSNCGQGDTQSAFMAADEGSIPTDVAVGYSDVLPKFMAVYGDPGDVADTGTDGALQRARMALDRAEANDATTEIQLQALRKALTDAQEADTAARAEYDAISQGPIYQAAVQEWMAKAAVTRAVADYNVAVTQSGEAQRVLDAMDYDDYVPLGNSELTRRVVLIVNGMGIVNLTELAQYANANLDMAAQADADGVYDTSESNFDMTGQLVVPNRLSNGELEAITERTGIDDARRNRDEHNVALETLKQLQTDNKNILLQPLIDEAVRRAQAEADYYSQQFLNALADDTNQNFVTVDNPSTPADEAAARSHRVTTIT